MEKYVININIKDKIRNYDRFVLCSKKSKKGLNDNDIKVYIIENELVNHVCNLCKMVPLWKNKPLDFVLDRRNNILTDNSIDNLRLLCPNCFSQVKKRSSIFMKMTKDNVIKCIDCNKTIKASKTGTKKNRCVHYRCKSCLDKQIINFDLSPYMDNNEYIGEKDNKKKNGINDNNDSKVNFEPDIKYI